MRLSPKQLVSLLDMLRFYSHDFVLLVGYMAAIEESLRFREEVDWDHLQGQLSELETICEMLGMALSVRQIRRLRPSVERKESNYLDQAIFELRTRIYDELESRQFLVFEGKKVEYYESSQPFGESVPLQFPSATFDVEEASRCFALGRDTACVMHLQRVIEVGLKAYGNLLGIPCLVNQSQPSWNRVLDETRKEIKERNDKSVPSKSWNSAEEKEFCEGIQPFLEAVKTAWRNPSMHADKIYNEEIAEDIFSAVKRFMKHLANHIDEKGAFTT